MLLTDVRNYKSCEASMTRCSQVPFLIVSFTNPRYAECTVQDSDWPSVLKDSWLENVVKLLQISAKLLVLIPWSEVHVALSFVFLHLGYNTVQRIIFPDLPS